MKILLTSLWFTATAVGLAIGADGLTIATVHPKSKELLKQHGEDLPEAVTKEYRLLYVRNTGIGNEGDSPAVNGVLVSRKPSFTIDDFVGFEHGSESWGVAGIFHLKVGARERAAAFLEEHSRDRIAVVVDGEWVFYEHSVNIRPREGLIIIEVLDRRDEERLHNLFEGKRGKDLEDPVPNDGPPIPPIPAPNYTGDQDETKAEQGGAGPPATRSESKSEGGDKPQPESEGRSR